MPRLSAIARVQAWGVDAHQRAIEIEESRASLGHDSLSIAQPAAHPARNQHRAGGRWLRAKPGYFTAFDGRMLSRRPDAGVTHRCGSVGPRTRAEERARGGARGTPGGWQDDTRALGGSTMARGE